MQALIFLLIVLLSSAAASPAVLNDTKGSLSARIIGGTGSVKVNYYEVAIVSDADAPPVKLCSGVLIKTKWVLTSAYCAKGKPVLRVVLGTPTIDELTIGQQGKLVDRVYPHPYYNSLYNIHDIALLYVPDASSATSITLAALPLNPISYNEYVGSYGVISGFGYQGNTATIGSYGLNNKQVEIIDNNYCLQEGHFMNYYKLCSAGGAACQGDSGGPLTIGNKVVGIVTVGLKALKCEGEVSTTYTRVNYYRAWIEQTINNCGCK